MFKHVLTGKFVKSAYVGSFFLSDFHKLYQIWKSKLVWPGNATITDQPTALQGIETEH